VYAELCGYGTTNDAYHPTAPRPDGAEAERAMRLALRDAGIAPDEVEHVNAHGSSTPLGDRAEAIALARLFADRVERVPISATKALYGHPLGASGAIEAALVALMLGGAPLAPAVNFAAAEDGSPEARLRLVAERCRSTLPRPRVALSNSFGFGGINATLVLKSCAA
jgi:3-oxoacyl-[acyl-carrier-protein] synthase II